MKETLKKLYQSHFIEPVSQYNFTEFNYFVDNTNNIFGISKNRMTENECALIASFFHLLKPEEIYNQSFQLLDYLFGNTNHYPPFSNLKYYFIKIFKKEEDEVNTEIYNILQSSFEEAYVTKRDDIYIILTGNEDNSFQEILQSIEADFFIKLIGYESDLYHDDVFLREVFQLDFNNLREYKKTNQLVIKKFHLLTNQILSHIDYENRKIIKQYILKEFISDQEMLKVLKVYFETNFNSSLAAKMCYMHRNTFLNKLEKFSITTNFNLKNYDEALIVYLSIIL